MSGPAKPVCILVLGGEMEKGLAAMNLALAAAAGGSEVTLFFTFWGLNFLRRPGAGASGSFLQRFMGLLNRDSAARQRLGRFHMAGAGRWAMRRLMRAKAMPEFRESLAMAKGMGVKVLACSTSLEVMGLLRESLVDEVDGVAGAAAFLEAARDATVVTMA